MKCSRAPSACWVQCSTECLVAIGGMLHAECYIYNVYSVVTLNAHARAGVMLLGLASNYMYVYIYM